MDHMRYQFADTRKQVVPLRAQDQDIDEGLDPYILVKIGTTYRSTYTLIDSGTHHNSMAYETFKGLKGVQLIPTNITLVGFSRVKLNTMGYVDVPMSINEIEGVY